MAKKITAVVPYTLTLKLLRKIEQAYMVGNIRADDILQFLKGHDINISRQHCRRCLKIVKARVKARYDKDFERDYVFIHESYMRLLKEADEAEDRAEQRILLKELAKLSGLEVQRIENKIVTFEVTSEQLENFNEMFN